MRKNFALVMVALLALTLALAAASCGKKAEQTTTETTAPVDTMMQADTTMKADTTMAK
jgi:hypothetical protein